MAEGAGCLGDRVTYWELPRPCAPCTDCTVNTWHVTHINTKWNGVDIEGDKNPFSKNTSNGSC